MTPDLHLINRDSLPSARVSEGLDGSLMKQRKYYERAEDSRSISGIKFWNTSATFVAYSKSLEALKKSDAYRNFYDSIKIKDHEEIIRTEIRHSSTFALNALYPVFLDAISEKSKEKMLQKLEQIEIMAFNSFLDAHPFVTKKGKKDKFIELLLRKDKVSTGYEEVEKLMNSFSTLTPRELFGVPAQREDVMESLLRTFFRLNMDPKKISRGDLAELQALYDVKRRRKYLEEGELLNAQRQSALLIADPRDYDAIADHFLRAQNELKYQLTS